ncbi:putative secreted protein (Por secretion system target) [Larkinella arboricola]|uniref:Putative secreted protein (Por secretion system target) n=1 Tax=Larkinella arboricola TaxID=643671 RepID=A0A327WVN9_LARAB|nr:T9SS type A sorting domain-containing protein [Larkinella arboricola]RAJ93160.1 putative secreted protein (Por secretion system target) [Larkinella arboricola]
MKALFNTLLIALTLTAASFNTVQADPNKPKKAAAFQTGIHTTAEGKLQVAVQKETSSAVVVRLLNANGQEVFAQQIGKRQEAVRLRMDVSNLPDGVYQVAISNGVETTTKEVTLTTKQIEAAPRLVAVN